MNNITVILLASLLYSIPYILGALSGIFSERSGIVNIGIEGFMISGAFFTSLFFYFFGSYFNLTSWYVIFLIIPLVIICNSLFSLIFSTIVIKFKTDQIISGLLNNAFALALFLTLTFFITGSEELTFNNYYNKKIFFNIYSFNFDSEMLLALTFIIVVIISNWFLFKTKHGLRIRAIGENKQAARSAGINIDKYKYIAIFISSSFAGISGMFLVFKSQSFQSLSISGQGFLSIAILILAKWKPLNSIFYAFLFGLTQYLVIISTGTFGIPIEFIFLFNTIPYVITILLLIFNYKNKSNSPEGLGLD